MNYELQYIGSGWSWLLILSWLSVLQWIITIYYVYFYKNKVKIYSLKSLQNVKIDGGKYGKYVSFMSDHFYWFWNIFPIVFFVHFFYIENSWAGWIQSLFLLDINNNVKDLYQSFFYSDIASKIDYMILAILSIASAFFGYIGQDKKHKNMLITKESLYWWSSTLNNKIYLLRKLFLVSNLILVGFLTYLITKISIFISLILYSSELNVFPFHIDGYGGFYPIMELSSILISMYLLRASMGLIGLDDHKGQGFAHLVGDILNVFYFVLSIPLIWIVFSKIKFHLSAANEKFNITEYLSNENFQKHIDNFINSEDKASAISNFHNYYSILVYNSFPIDITLFYNTIFTAVMPISIWFLINNYRDKIHE